MRKTIEQLKKLNTKNLLRYFRAERKRFFHAISQHHFGFDAVDYYQKEKVKYDEWESYLSLIKIELSTREHVGVRGTQ